MQQKKMTVPQLWVIASLLLSVQETVNIITYKSMVSIMQKKRGLDHASENIEFTLSIALTKRPSGN